MLGCHPSCRQTHFQTSPWTIGYGTLRVASFSPPPQLLSPVVVEQAVLHLIRVGWGLY